MKISSDGLPGVNTYNIGLFHLNEYLDKKRDVYSPKVQVGVDYKNLLMLYYYRNPLNHIFYLEGLIIASLFSFGQGEAWKKGVVQDELFERTCFLAELLKREEVIFNGINKETRGRFDEVLKQMTHNQILSMSAKHSGHVHLSSTNETTILFIGSIIWPMIDSYYVTLMFALSMLRNKGVESILINKKV